MRHGPLLYSLQLICALIVATERASAVTFEEQSERLQLVYAHLLDFRSQRTPVVKRPHQREVEVEILHRPAVDHRIGNKTEPVESPTLLPRFRLRQFFADSFYLGVGLVPPLVEVEDFRYRFWGQEFGKDWELSDHAALGTRLYFADSHVVGPVTMPDAEDSFSVQQYGADVSLGYRLDSVLFLAGGGNSRVKTSLRVEESGVLLKVPARPYAYGFLGIGYFFQPDVRLHFVQHASEHFLRHWNLSITLLQ